MTAAVPKLKRVLPGIAYKDQFDKLVTLKGVLNYSSSRVQWVETDSKIHPLVALIGDTFIYVCQKCGATIYEQEVQGMRQADIEAGMMFPRPARCVFCSGPVKRAQKGDKVVLHYRFLPDGSSGAWWAKRWDW